MKTSAPRFFPLHCAPSRRTDQSDRRGQVIERPAAVVRELLDNALDAGASASITVRLQAGGVRLIAVEDDGVGIAPQQLPPAVQRHATSKIRSLHDLESVATMGFRGEALAAIAAVSELSVLSATAGAARPFSACAQRTAPGARARATVEVRELFFSTPARLNSSRVTLPNWRIAWMPCAARPGASGCRLCCVARRQAAGAVARNCRHQPAHGRCAGRRFCGAEPAGEWWPANGWRRDPCCWPLRPAGLCAQPSRPAVCLRQWPFLSATR